MHVSDIEMRDDELLKAGRGSSIGSGSGSGKQGLKSNCSSQAAAPKDLKMGLAVLALPQVAFLAFTPGLIPSWLCWRRLQENKLATNNNISVQ